MLTYYRDKPKETNITGDGDDVDHAQSEQQQLVTESVTDHPTQLEHVQSTDTTGTTEQPKPKKSECYY